MTGVRRPRRSSRDPFVPEGKSLTKQAFSDPADINNIVAKFISTGTLDWFNRLEPRFGDFSGVEDYHACLNRVVEAQQAFDALPAKVRAHFENDPARLVEAAHDPERREELRALGFVPLGESVTEGYTPAAKAGGPPPGAEAPEGSGEASDSTP